MVGAAQLKLRLCLSPVIDQKGLLLLEPSSTLLIFVLFFAVLSSRDRGATSSSSCSRNGLGTLSATN